VDVPDNLLHRSEYNHARCCAFRTVSVLNSSVAVVVFVMDGVKLSFVCWVWDIRRLW
jgi:hypothetical protein